MSDRGDDGSDLVSWFRRWIEAKSRIVRAWFRPAPADTVEVAGLREHLRRVRAALDAILAHLAGGLDAPPEPASEMRRLNSKLTSWSFTALAIALLIGTPYGTGLYLVGPLAFCVFHLVERVVALVGSDDAVPPHVVPLAHLTIQCGVFAALSSGAVPYLWMTCAAVGLALVVYSRLSARFYLILPIVAVVVLPCALVAAAYEFSYVPGSGWLLEHHRAWYRGGGGVVVALIPLLLLQWWEDLCIVRPRASPLVGSAWRNSLPSIVLWLTIPTVLAGLVLVPNAPLLSESSSATFVAWTVLVLAIQGRVDANGIFGGLRERGQPTSEATRWIARGCALLASSYFVAWAALRCARLIYDRQLGTFWQF